MFPMSNRSPCNSTPLIEGSLRIASVSWSSPPTPGSVDSSRSKISDVRTSRPVIARFKGASLRGGFSTKSETGKHACDWWSLVTFQQVLTGLPVGLSYRHVGCTACQQNLQEGQRVTVYAYRCMETPDWEVARCFCADCAPEAVKTPTLGAAECVVSATLGVQSVVTEQRHRYCLTEVEVAAQSPPTEGTEP